MSLSLHWLLLETTALPLGLYFFKVIVMFRLSWRTSSAVPKCGVAGEDFLLTVVRKDSVSYRWDKHAFLHIVLSSVAY